jgi:dipeptidase E
MLAGGGNAADSQPLDKIFAAWTGRGGKMLYLPIANTVSQHVYAQTFRWVYAIFQPLGVGDVEMWTTLVGHTAEELNAYDSVYIGGGNTFHLLALLKQSGFDNHLAEYARAGKPVYGSSAGAVVMGRNILTASHFDPNDEALVDTRGLDLARGHAIWPHYEPEHDPLIYEYIHKYALPVLAVTERSGIGIEGERMIAWGHEPSYRFTRRRKKAVQPGEQV